MGIPFTVNVPDLSAGGASPCPFGGAGGAKEPDVLRSDAPFFLRENMKMNPTIDSTVNG